MTAAIRAFFDNRGYLEVETPVRIPAPAPEGESVPEGDAHLEEIDAE